MVKFYKPDFGKFFCDQADKKFTKIQSYSYRYQSLNNKKFYINKLVKIIIYTSFTVLSMPTSLNFCKQNYTLDDIYCRLISAHLDNLVTNL